MAPCGQPYVINALLTHLEASLIAMDQSQSEMEIAAILGNSHGPRDSFATGNLHPGLFRVNAAAPIVAIRNSTLSGEAILVGFMPSQ